MIAEKILEDKKTGISFTETEVLNEIERIKMQLVKSKMNFDMATDEVLIDCYIYEIIALNKKYQYFLRLAKKYNISVDVFNTKEVRKRIKYKK